VGSYASFSIDGYQLLSSKSMVNAVVMMVFTEAEKQIRYEKYAESNPTEPSSGDESEEEGLRTIVEYVVSGTVVLDRLETMGFTIQATRKLYEREHAHRISELEGWSAESFDRGELFHDEIKSLKQLDFDTWIKHFRELKQKNVHDWDFTLNPSNPVVQSLSALEKFFLTDEEFLFRFPPCDLRYVIRAVIEACGVGSSFSVDLSDLVDSGYNEAADSIANSARDELTLDYPLNTKVIVLNEGVTDRRVLEASLKLLYPHLTDYYAFMDFDGANAPGGAGQLVNTVKAFAGAGIANRVIALFDNDTAARSALRGLDGVSLPSSVRVLKYPVIGIASKYPTVGPSGLVQMDVNGLAGGLEIYFGEDVLRLPDGTFNPVHWRGFDSAVRSYQGELENKAALQEKFNQKLAAARADLKLIHVQDWTGIRAILDMLRSAFENEVS
jgi:hypothetical protein